MPEALSFIGILDFIWIFNPSLTSGLIRPYHLDEFIPGFRVSSGCFSFYTAFP